MTTNPKIMILEDAVCDCFLITRDDLYQRSRFRYLVEARYLIIYAMVTTFGITISQASRIYGLDHSTGHYAMKEVPNWIKNDRKFRAKAEKVIQLVK